MMACNDIEIECEFLAALEIVDRIEISGDTLKLSISGRA
jgi:hypothetical protein